MIYQFNKLCYGNMHHSKWDEGLLCLSLRGCVFATVGRAIQVDIRQVTATLLSNCKVTYIPLWKQSSLQREKDKIILMLMAVLTIYTCGSYSLAYSPCTCTILPVTS